MPIYSSPEAQLTASDRGTANGVASLDNSSLVPVAQLPLATAVAPGAKGAGQSIDIVCSGDITASLTTAIATLAAGNGGRITLSAGSGYCTAQLAIPNDGATPPKQKSIRISGAGPGHTGDQQLNLPAPPPMGGTILDLRYASGPKINTVGTGNLEIDHLTLEDTTDGTQPFIHDSRTTMHIHDVLFYGKTVYSAATEPPFSPIPQEAIVLGDGVFNGDNFLGFQTVIERCHFNRISRYLHGYAWANSVVFRNNAGAVGCGGHAAVTLDGSGGSSSLNGFSWANTIADNLFEATNYTYGIELLNNASYNTIVGNAFWDPSGTNSFFYADATSVGNYIAGGFMQDPATSGYNQVITGGGSAKQTIISTQVPSSVNGSPLLTLASPKSVVKYDAAVTGESVTVTGLSSAKRYRIYTVMATNGTTNEMLKVGPDGNVTSLSFSSVWNKYYNVATEVQALVVNQHHPADPEPRIGSATLEPRVNGLSLLSFSSRSAAGETAAQAQWGNGATSIDFTYLTFVFTASGSRTGSWLKVLEETP